MVAVIPELTAVTVDGVGHMPNLLERMQGSPG